MFDCAKSTQSYAQFSLKLVDNDIRVPVVEQPPIPLPKQTSSLDRRRAIQFLHLQLDTSKSELQKNVAIFGVSGSPKAEGLPPRAKILFQTFARSLIFPSWQPIGAKVGQKVETSIWARTKSRMPLGLETLRTQTFLRMSWAIGCLNATSMVGGWK